MIRQIVQRLGATRMGVWTIKHLIAPLDRWLYLRTSGRRVALGKPLAPTLLLTTTGRRSGQPRTTPVFYHRDGEVVSGAFLSWNRLDTTASQITPKPGR